MKAGQLYDDIMRDPDVDVVEEVLSSKALWRIMDKLTEEKHSMKNHRTAKLWLQYMEMIGILRMFIKAERTGDWALHLQTIQAMLPYFAAAGHVCEISTHVFADDARATENLPRHSFQFPQRSPCHPEE